MLCLIIISLYLSPIGWLCELHYFSLKDSQQGRLFNVFLISGTLSRHAEIPVDIGSLSVRLAGVDSERVDIGSTPCSARDSQQCISHLRNSKPARRDELLWAQCNMNRINFV